MINLDSLPLPKQLVQLRMYLSLEIQRVLEHTLHIPPTDQHKVEEVLEALQTYLRDQRNEPLRRHELLSCRQVEGGHLRTFTSVCDILQKNGYLPQPFRCL